MVRRGRPPGRKFCIIDDCGSVNFGHGYCNKHYLRWKSTGDPLEVKKVAKNVYDFDWIKSQCIENDRGCWEWQNAKDENGYGLFSKNRKNIRVHRLMLSFFLGKELNPKLIVLHSCDNPPCCNPEHLREGTRRDNVLDMDSRSRRVPPTSMTSHKRKLMPEQVLKIRKCYISSDQTIAELARIYNVDWSTIKAIVSHKTWKDLPE